MKLSSLNLKWENGGNVSSGISEYKEKFSDYDVSESNFYLTSMVSIQFANGNPKFKKKILMR